MSHVDEPLSGHNLAFVEAAYARFLEDPTSVDADWRHYFQRLSAENGDVAAAQRALAGPGFQPASIFNPPGSKAEAVPLRLDDLPPVAPEVLAERQHFLQGLRLFQAIKSDEIALVARLAEEERFRDGDFLFREAEQGHALYIVIDGALLVRRKDNIVATLNRGEVVGELSVLDAQPRYADVIAHGEVRVLRLESEGLLALIDQRPALARGLIGILSGRLRERSSRQDKVNQLIHNHRVRGHLLARLDPLEIEEPPHIPDLELVHYGLGEKDLDALFSSTTISGTTVLSLGAIFKLLRTVYCGSIGVQFMHIDDLSDKEWLLTRLEDSKHHRRLSRDEQLRILTKLTDAEIFEQFIHKKFTGAKRFSLEGAETLIPLLDLALEEAAGQGVKEVVIGMAHRGRLNVLVNIMGKSPQEVFREYADDNPDSMIGRGDVKYHLGYSSDRTSAQGETMHLSLCFNPSHLEFVNPVVNGRVRAKQDRFRDSEHRHCMGILIHGDAAFAGQGVVQEMLNLSDLEGYRTGGTVHIIVNNQIGFTTAAERGRSTRYATDVARMLQTPIFHVNGEKPEAVAQVVQIAMGYRERFRKDVIIDMYCYRRHGHNEGDEPSYTQPLLYNIIKKRQTVRKAYLESLLELGEVSAEEAATIAETRSADLDEALSRAQRTDYKLRGPKSGEGLWHPYRGGADVEVSEVRTTVSREKLAALLHSLDHVPAGFSRHRKLNRFFQARTDMAAGERPFDWGTAEALAFASLLVEGTRVRLSGQDSGRGTFSHRHAVLRDVKTGEPYVPLAKLTADQAPFQVLDSPLSEVGVLGFEYGYSLDTPDGLTLWEAQFGDFCNVAQMIFDQFITSGEDKWRRLSGLVMLLPHGFEGQGPEHSSARLERFLNLAAEDNIQVVNLTTPAQYFHCLRRQILRPLRKPLVVMSPKSLLRLGRAVSPFEDFTDGQFQRLIPDVGATERQSVRKVLLTSGKVYYDLEEAREKREAHDVAIVRLEQYYPLADAHLLAVLKTYADGTPLVWVQEEPENMGAWRYMRLRLDDKKFARWPLAAVCRAESASPATGSAAAHKKEQAELLDKAFA